MAIDRYLNHTPAPIYGIRQGFNIADLPSSTIGVVALNAVSASTTSSAISMGARSIEIALTFDTAGATCDLKLYTALDSFAAPVWTKTGISDKSADSLFVGGTEGYDLNGYDLKIRAENISAGKVTVTLKRTS